MGRSTFGSVSEMRKGVYRLRWWEDTPQGRKRRSEVIHVRSRREAERKLAEIRVAVEEKRSPTCCTLWETDVRPLMEQDVERGQMSAQSLKTYDEIWSGKVKPAFGHVPVAEVTPVAVQDFILSIPRSSVGSCKSVLSHIMQRAMMLEYRDNDPTRIRFKLPPAGRKYSEGVWTLEQLDQAWGVLRGSVVETPFLLCAHAGLRVGEAFGLKVSDLAYDGEFMTISVERAVSKDGNVCPLKTATSRRVAVMAQPYAGRLAEIVAEQEGEWLIPDGMGFVLDRNKAEKVWRKAARSTGLPYITMSRLRNSYETYMHWEVGISQERVSKILGHAKVGTTQTYYDLPHADSVASSIIDAIRNATE